MLLPPAALGHGVTGCHLGYSAGVGLAIHDLYVRNETAETGTSCKKNKGTKNDGMNAIEISFSKFTYMLDT